MTSRLGVAAPVCLNRRSRNNLVETIFETTLLVPDSLRFEAEQIGERLSCVLIGHNTIKTQKNSVPF